jgi:hypothetical protein
MLDPGRTSQGMEAFEYYGTPIKFLAATSLAAAEYSH